MNAVEAEGTRAAVDDITLFRRLPPEVRAKIAALARLRSCERGAVLFDEGDPSRSFFFVVLGRVKVFRLAPSGREVILEIFGPGDPLGAVAVYEALAYPASATALDHATCLSIPRRDFFALLEQHPGLVRGLLSGLTIRLAELTRRLAELGAAFCTGRARPTDAALVTALSDDIRDGALCGLERSATNPLRSGMRYFAQEFEDHIVRGMCPAGVCQPIRVAAVAH